jgi:predicted RNA-binding protein YlxR (DUF448 family)
VSDGPIRTCVGCRTRREQRELQRFVRHGDRWAADSGPRSNGRGVYLCGAQCAQAVIKNKRYPGFGSFAITHYGEFIKRDTHMND